MPRLFAVSATSKVPAFEQIDRSVVTSMIVLVVFTLRLILFLRGFWLQHHESWQVRITFLVFLGGLISGGMNYPGKSTVRL